ncbi:DNA-binding LacI/PurR family transcriptional regulator [Aureibacillus halotolerans]|uniref:DNA-binding LacI/PurR family transcriptional regulator n=1 Tax=Aureibacillus halotolerans TaxID=1508390 RepID=A0A4R6TXU2_9BACI|nr:DNA-binding LacI/PurR family transcriptional regulator [Aureibacillus halotolerans]
MYAKIMEELKKDIVTGKLTAHQQLPTELELADTFSVSRITSKRALSELEREGFIYRRRGSGSFVKPRRLGDNAKADKIVAFVLPFEKATGLMNYLQGAAEVFNEHRYMFTICTTHEEIERERDWLVELPHQNVRGLLFYPISDKANMDVLYRLTTNQTPIVLLDKQYEGLPMTSVTSDNRDGGRKAVQHLITLGHSHIGYISTVPIETTSTVRDRYFGYCDALRHAGLEASLQFMLLNVNGTYKLENRSEQLAEALIDMMTAGMTAIVAENDLVAIQIIKLLSAKGYRVPEDLSIVGFDDTEVARHTEPSLTTIAQDFLGIGRLAAKSLLEQAENQTVEAKKYSLPVELVIRESTAPPRNPLAVAEERTKS